MRLTCRISKATDSHSCYEIPTAFTPQQSLQERALMLSYTYNAGRVKIRKPLLSSRHNRTSDSTDVGNLEYTNCPNAFFETVHALSNIIVVKAEQCIIVRYYFLCFFKVWSHRWVHKVRNKNIKSVNYILLLRIYRVLRRLHKYYSDETCERFIWGPYRTCWASVRFVTKVRVISIRTFHVYSHTDDLHAIPLGKFEFSEIRRTESHILHMGANIRLSPCYLPYLMFDFREIRC